MAINLSFSVCREPWASCVDIRIVNGSQNVPRGNTNIIEKRRSLIERGLEHNAIFKPTIAENYLER